MTRSRGLLDTSVLIAQETGRRLDRAAFPDDAFISVVSIAELQAGVLAAPDTVTRSKRMRTLDKIADSQVLTIDVVAASFWARFRVALREQDLRINVNDLWIAAVAAANGLPVVTQDSDFDALEAIGGPEVIRV